MRSCEYSTVSGERKTKLLTFRDISFYMEGSTVRMAFDHPNIATADVVSVTFRDQKNGEKEQTRTAWRTSLPDACPVRAIASIIRRAKTSSRFIFTASTSVNTYKHNTTTKRITSTMILTRLRAAATMMGFQALGTSSKTIGTHSIRSGAAMALVLSGQPAWRVMIAGRWKSTAFLAYIREQVQTYSKGVAQCMTENPSFIQLDRSTPSIDASCLLPVGHNDVDGIQHAVEVTDDEETDPVPVCIRIEAQSFLHGRASSTR